MRQCSGTVNVLQKPEIFSDRHFEERGNSIYRGVVRQCLGTVNILQKPEISDQHLEERGS